MDFKLKQFLIENSLTSNSRLLKELDVRKGNISPYIDDFYEMDEEDIEMLETSIEDGQTELIGVVVDEKRDILLDVHHVYGSPGRIPSFHVTYEDNEGKMYQGFFEPFGLENLENITPSDVRREAPGWPKDMYEFIADYFN